MYALSIQKSHPTRIRRWMGLVRGQKADFSLSLGEEGVLFGSYDQRCIVLWVLGRAQLGDERAQLAEGAAGHLLQAIELLGDLCRIALQEQASGLGGERGAKDHLADRIVQLARQAAALLFGGQVFHLGGIALELAVGHLQLAEYALVLAARRFGFLDLVGIASEQEADAAVEQCHRQCKGPAFLIGTQRTRDGQGKTSDKEEPGSPPKGQDRLQAERDEQAGKKIDVRRDGNSPTTRPDCRSR
jgi:hypothetical protein